MTCCPSCYQNNCPETPDITINQTIVQLDDSEAFFHDEYFNRASGGIVESVLASGNYVKIELAYTPVSSESVQLVRNALIQRRNTDFIVNGKNVYLTVGASLADVIQVRYFSASGATQLTGVTTGAMLAYDGATFDGFLKMDGATVRSASTYPELEAYLILHPDLVSAPSPYTGGDFTLRLLSDTMYDGSTLVSIPKWIKY